MTPADKISETRVLFRRPLPRYVDKRGDSAYVLGIHQGAVVYNVEPHAANPVRFPHCVNDEATFYSRWRTV